MVAAAGAWRRMSGGARHVLPRPRLRDTACRDQLTGQLGGRAWHRAGTHVIDRWTDRRPDGAGRSLLMGQGWITLAR